MWSLVHHHIPLHCTLASTGHLYVQACSDFHLDQRIDAVSRATRIGLCPDGRVVRRTWTSEGLRRGQGSGSFKLDQNVFPWYFCPRTLFYAVHVCDFMTRDCLGRWWRCGKRGKRIVCVNRVRLEAVPLSSAIHASSRSSRSSFHAFSQDGAAKRKGADSPETHHLHTTTSLLCFF